MSHPRDAPRPRGPPRPDEARESAGARWVRRYFLPVVARERGLQPGERLRVLQIQPDDEDEARCLRALGHACDVLLCTQPVAGSRVWEIAPRWAPELRIPAADGAYDLVLSGRFSAVTASPERRERLAAEIGRVCAGDGAALLTIGNRLCPLDLSGGGVRLHGRDDPSLLALFEVCALFRGPGGFRSVRPLSLAGQFGAGTGSRSRRIAARLVDRYLAAMGAFREGRLYRGALNPMLAVWISRRERGPAPDAGGGGK